MRRSGVLLLSVLLGMSLWSCKTNDNISEVMKAWEKKLERARAGLPTDFDGDGFEEYLQRTDANGVIHVEIRYPSGNLSSVSERHPDGTKIASYYWDGFEKPYKKMEKKFDSQVYLIDTDNDGVFDKRVTNTFDLKNKVNHRVFEKIDADGNTLERTEKTEPLSRMVPAPSEKETVSVAQKKSLEQALFEPQYAYPTPKGGPSKDIGNRVGAGTGKDNGNCGKDQREKIKKAVDTIFAKNSEVLSCLNKFNPGMGEEIKEENANQRPYVHVRCDMNQRSGFQKPGDKMAGERSRETRCKPDEKGKPTDDCRTVGYNTEKYPGEIHIDPGTFEKNDTDFMSMFLHEYLHVLGYGYDKDHDEGKDEVYSCARYCAGRSNAGKGATGNPFNDCVGCTGKNPTEAVKEACKAECSSSPGTKKLFGTAFGSISEELCAEFPRPPPPPQTTQCPQGVPFEMLTVGDGMEVEVTQEDKHSIEFLSVPPGAQLFCILLPKGEPYDTGLLQIADSAYQPGKGAAKTKVRISMQRLQSLVLGEESKAKLNNISGLYDRSCSGYSPRSLVLGLSKNAEIEGEVAIEGALCIATAHHGALNIRASLSGFASYLSILVGGDGAFGHFYLGDLAANEVDIGFFFPTGSYAEVSPGARFGKKEFNPGNTVVCKTQPAESYCSDIDTHPDEMPCGGGCDAPKGG